MGRPGEKRDQMVVFGRGMLRDEQGMVEGIGVLGCGMV